MATRPLTEAEVLPVFEPIVLEQTDALAGRRLRAVASWARGAFLLDAVMLLAAALAADLGSRDAGIVRTSPVWLVAYGAIVLVAFYLRGLYAWRVRLQVLDGVRTVVTMTALASMVLLTLRILLPGEVVDLSREEDPEREQDHRGERGHRHDRAHAVEDLQADAPCVEPAEVEGDEHDRPVRDEPDRRRADDPGVARAEIRGERSRQQHHGVEQEGAACPRRDGAQAPTGERVGLLEHDRLEDRQHLSFRQGSRGHALPHRRSVYVRLDLGYFFARPSLRRPVPAASSSAATAAI